MQVTTSRRRTLWLSSWASRSQSSTSCASMGPRGCGGTTGCADDPRPAGTHPLVGEAEDGPLGNDHDEVPGLGRVVAPQQRLGPWATNDLDDALVAGGDKETARVRGYQPIRGEKLQHLVLRSLHRTYRWPVSKAMLWAVFGRPECPTNSGVAFAASRVSLGTRERAPRHMPVIQLEMDRSKGAAKGQRKKIMKPAATAAALWSDAGSLMENRMPHISEPRLHRPRARPRTKRRCKLRSTPLFSRCSLTLQAVEAGH